MSVDVSAPSSDQIKHAMLCGLSAEYEGIIYDRIVGYCARVRQVGARNVLVLEAELLDCNKNTIVVTNPKRIVIKNYVG